MKKLILLPALLILTSMAGCASNDDLEAVRATALKAESTANEALATARNAENIALEAKATANDNEQKLDSMAKGRKSKRK